MPGVYIPDPDAPETIERLAAPGLEPTARAIGDAIPRFVPVHTGVMERTYDIELEEADDGYRVHVGSPFWHWLEYGTRFNPAYRPVETAVRSLGLRFEPQ